MIARRVAPVTGAFVLGFVIWTHVTASTTFFLNPVELLAVLAAIAAVWLVYDHRDGFAFAATTVTMAACIVSIFTGLYPNVMVSSTSKAYNLTVRNTASGPVLAQGPDRSSRSSSAAGADRYQVWERTTCFRRRVSADDFRWAPPGEGDSLRRDSAMSDGH